MRVLAVSTWLPTPTSPATGTFVVKDAHAIASLGHDVALVHLVPPAQADAPERGELEGFPVTRIPLAPSRPDQVIRAGLALRPLIAQADLLHTMAFPTLLPLRVAGRSGRRRVPWVHTEHYSGVARPDTLSGGMRLLVPRLLPLLRGPDVVTAVCEHLAEPIRTVRGPRPTTVVPCVVPPVPGGPRPRREVTRDALRLVGVGGLVEGKDPVLAVRVVAELARRGWDVSLRLVGDGPLAGAVRSEAVSLGISERVELTGVHDRDGVLAALADADVFLGPTTGDNFYVSCAEAVASGRPVVVGERGGHVEYLTPEVSRAVASREPSVWADAVEDVLVEARGWSAQRIADTLGERFWPATVAAGFADAYRRAVSGTEGRADTEEER